jgi:serine/threonine protein kinase/tetratricopeptide (TPR) repeat protein
MRRDLFVRAKKIVAVALERPREHRATFLDDACGGDAELRAEVESLLDHDVDTPTVLLTGGLGGADWGSILAELAPELPAPVGRRIGPYEIVATLGHGGMGTVYHARQLEPVRRDVALKLIKRGLDTARVIARFEAERQTLAVLDHPGIARMLDAGAGGDGRPYFVMELVRGLPITDYADARRLSISERLSLFLQVCRAIQHAHQKGVLHRDLKPSNVLVTEQDGVAAPKVIDFGIAKAIEPDPHGGATLTELGQLVGTPEYMSPEQAGSAPGGADTRSDVYSLGVMLYELLTGRRPHRLRGLPVAEVQRVISREDPIKPSAALAAGEPADAGASPTAVAQAVGDARVSTLPRLRRLLAGDLDNIVLMSLRKEPERRYAGVEQFAADIRRYLDGLPVQARQDTWTYRTGKFVRRHRFGAAVAVAALIALVGFSAMMTYERNRAREAEALAQQEAATALQVSGFLVELFRQADPYVNQGDELSVRDVLDQGAQRIDQDLRGQPAVQAALMATMSEAYTGIRAPEPALGLAERSLALSRELYGERHEQVATSLVALAAAHASGSRQDLAMPLYREALAMRQQLLPPDHPDIFEAKRLLGLNLNTMAEFDEAEALYREVHEWTLRTRGDDEAAVAASFERLGVILHAQAKDLEALEALQEALARSEAAGPITTADIHSELAVLLKNMDRPEQAEPHYREALAIRERTLGEHPDTAQSHNNLGVFLRGRGQEEEALPHLRRALEIHRAAFGENHLEVAIAYTNLASALKSLGRTEEAAASYEASLASLENSMGRDYWVYGQVEYNYGVLLRDTGRFAEAEELMVRGYESVRDALGADSGRALAITEGIVDLYEQWGKTDEEAKYRALLPRGEGR